MRGDTSEPSAGMFAGSLRDAIGNVIQVMMYHVPYIGPAGDLRHLIGVREQGDVDEELGASG